MKLSRIIYIFFYFLLLFFGIACDSDDPEPTNEHYPEINIISPLQATDLYYSGDTMFIEAIISDNGALNLVRTLIEDSENKTVFTLHNQLNTSSFFVDTIYVFENIQCTNYFLTIFATNTAGYTSEKKIYIHSMP